MADVFEKCVTANGYNNGSAVVSIGTLAVTSNHTLSPKVNQVSQIPAQSGVLDSRLDDVRYYSGDTSA